MSSHALLRRLARGDVANVRFSDLRRLLGDLGFERLRVTAATRSMHPSISELVNLQEVKGQVKPYQLRLLVRLVERYDLRLEDWG